MMVSCTEKKEAYEAQSYLMGTVVSVKIYGDNGQKSAADVFKRISAIEKMMTINASGSEIDKLNSAAGKNYVKLSPESIFVISTANKYSALCNGAFDITVGPLVKEWGIGTDNPKIPEKEKISELIRLVGYKDIVIDEKKNSVKLLRPKQVVDLGGIAKGFAGDEAIRIFKSNGITSAYVNLGGNVVALGKKPDGSPWHIAIQNPRSANGTYIGILEVSDKAVVTSGDYERFFEKDNVRYHHILDPKTGYPARSGLISVTIVYDISIDSDALSTTSFILGMKEGYGLISRIKGAEAIFVTDEKKVYITKGLDKIFTFKDATGEFHFEGILK
jgi:FAD:protein FMN transferase